MSGRRTQHNLCLTACRCKRGVKPVCHTSKIVIRFRDIHIAPPLNAQDVVGNGKVGSYFLPPAWYQREAHEAILCLNRRHKMNFTQRLTFSGHYTSSVHSPAQFIELKLLCYTPVVLTATAKSQCALGSIHDPCCYPRLDTAAHPSNAGNCPLKEGNPKGQNSPSVHSLPQHECAYCT